MSIINGFIPLPNWYITRGFTLKLTHREKVLYFTIGVEIFRFPESRETMSKEMTTRGLQSITGIDHSHIAKILNKFQRMGIIEFQKSFTKGISSIVAIIFPDMNKSIAEIATSDKNLGNKKATYPKNQFKKDHQESISDSSLNSKIEQEIKEKPIETSLDSKSIIEDNQKSSKISNTNNPINNLLTGGQASIGKNDFTALGNVLNISAPAPQVNSSGTLSEKTIIEGKEILFKKGFSAEETVNIVNRITLAMNEKNIKSREKYFLASCDKEIRKNNPAGSIHKVTCAALPAKNNFNNTVKKWEEEKKNDIKPEEKIKQLMTLRPDDLYRVILDVDNSPAGKFISLPEIKASLYISEFKKRFPEVII